MKSRLGLSLVALAVLAMPAWPQTGSDQSQTGSTGQSQTGSTDQSQSDSTDQSQQSSTGPQAAYTHPEQLPPLALLNEVTASTGIKLNMTSGFLTDYNAVSGVSSPSYWETQGQFTGGIHITQIRPTLLWDIGYNGGVTLSALSSSGYSNYLSLNQNAHGDVIWQFSNRWRLQAKDYYVYTSDPFSPYLTIDGLPTFNDPNPVLYIPQAIIEQNLGSVNLTYQMSQHDGLTFTGGESFQRYYNSPLEGNDNYSYSGSTNYQHNFSARLSAGGGYSFTALDFGHGLSRSGVQAITGFATYQLTPTMSISGWVGPEYTSSKAIVPTFCFPGFGCFGYHAQYQAEWNVTEGATFNWTGMRNALRGGFTHQVSNGGGYLGAVRFYQVTAGYRRTLTQHWNFVAGASYNNSLSILFTNANRYLRSVQLRVAFSRDISNSWNATIYYALIHESQNYFSSQPYTLGANGAGVTLRYTWGHSLGR